MGRFSSTHSTEYCLSILGGDDWSRTSSAFRAADLQSTGVTNFPTTPNLLNSLVKTYKNYTPSGLNFHLSLSDTGVCCIIVYDIYDNEARVRYFTDVNRALRFINNL